LNTSESFEKQLYANNAVGFEDIALDLFRFQAEHNPVYREYIHILGLNPLNISRLEDIPFMPISFFKTHAVKTGVWTAETIYSSSGTTGLTTSTHPVRSVDFYLRHAEHCFRKSFGDPSQYHVLALLPSYLEREGSSLVAMVDYLIRRSGSPSSGFYLHNRDTLLTDLKKLRNSGRRIMLWGVTFALLDLAEQIGPDLGDCMIFETGGMKGRRKEITRQELHDIIRSNTGAKEIYSEYGMTELLSQAYTTGGTRFQNNPWLRVIGRDLSDPFEKGLLDETCGINVIDLANIHSVAFIETQDIGRVYADGSFEVLGRMDNSDVRGCNLMVQ